MVRVDLGKRDRVVVICREISVAESGGVSHYHHYDFEQCDGEDLQYEVLLNLSEGDGGTSKWTQELGGVPT
jgi:hypothetical protein